MDRLFFTVRYSRYSVVLIAILAISTFLDTLCWRHTVHRLETVAHTAIATARKNGWVVNTTPSHRGGWPFGAWVELDRLDATHPASSGAPYDAGWAAEHLRLGGSWPFLLGAELPVSLTGHQAARLVLNNAILTFVTADLQIRFKNPQDLCFSVSQLKLAFSGHWPDKQIFAKNLSGRLIRFPEALAGATRLGIDAKAADLSGFPLPYGASVDLHQMHLALALTASDASTELSLLDPSSYGRLLLQDASASPASTNSRIILSGAMALPSRNGTLTLTVIQWQTLADRLLAQPEIESHLAPDLQVALRKALEKTSTRQARNGQPLSMAIPVVNGEILPDTQAFSALFNGKAPLP
ncbi:DUF2125 domain-containing protein [Gluconobacter albidus]|uniref:DUF2125 domain-containing protein n=1 Tax=Gluconobacter albidus TaxID=318683 RepID=UPI001B8C5F5E|nr:DUF2125 domain-containing protein [Gluconobacter albidus]MBS1026603.1 DUF2125 domain-containing protein [Gluconobacter albidus]